MRDVKTKLCLSLALSLSLLSGCASIVGNSTYPVAISSSPAGANFEIKDANGRLMHTGTTPSTVSLKSGNGYFGRAHYTIAFQKEGHEPNEVRLDSELSGWYWGNILFGGLIGMLIVDPLTGAMYKLPEAASAELGEKVAGQADGNSLTLLTLDQVPEALREQMIRVN
ncbi:hypothetical protein NVV93_02390 [Pseudomonas sp. LS44]|uniref:hypothetical protein n=1 Tax=Pseudomonas sp. LS44 TaxID=1357074 RepID=UPI00215B22E5|nr:hypothetical protein [Pseudomonas sp. LS44]UVE18269.1 hypothetical protein NVV93_02390 [Pseudomonas sp. LS44]